MVREGYIDRSITGLELLREWNYIVAFDWMWEDKFIQSCEFNLIDDTLSLTSGSDFSERYNIREKFNRHLTNSGKLFELMDRRLFEPRREDAYKFIFCRGFNEYDLLGLNYFDAGVNAGDRYWFRYPGDDRCFRQVVLAKGFIPNRLNRWLTEDNKLLKKEVKIDIRRQVVLEDIGRTIFY